MQRPLLLRIDFTRQGRTLDLPRAAREEMELCSIRPDSALHTEIETITPDILCFDYDFPDVTSLSILTQTKQAFPSVPILMLTEQKSEELAVWALRARVWDYFVKPLDADAFVKTVQQLHALRNNARGRAGRKLVAPATSRRSPTHRNDPLHSGLTGTMRAVARAKAYVAENLDAKISAKSVATLCNMSPFHFSRSFKRVCGMTFSDFLLQARITRAIELLGHPGASVTSVCFEVGFRDSSYFGRIFKRYAGLTPSEYRNRCKNEASRRAEKGANGVSAGSKREDSAARPEEELVIEGMTPIRAK